MHKKTEFISEIEKSNISLNFPYTQWLTLKENVSGKTYNGTMLKLRKSCLRVERDKRDKLTSVWVRTYLAGLCVMIICSCVDINCVGSYVYQAR